MLAVASISPSIAWNAAHAVTDDGTFGHFTDADLTSEAVHYQGQAADMAVKAEFFARKYAQSGAGYDFDLARTYQRRAASFAMLARLRLIELLRRQECDQ